MPKEVPTISPATVVTVIIALIGWAVTAGVQSSRIDALEAKAKEHAASAEKVVDLLHSIEIKLESHAAAHRGLAE